MARNKLPGVIPCGKVGEFDEVYAALKATGAHKRAVRFGEGLGETFDFASWEMGRLGKGRNVVENLVSLISEIGETLGNVRATGENSHWEATGDEVIRVGLNTNYHATGRCNLLDLRRWMDTLPVHESDLNNTNLYSIQALYGAEKRCPASRRADIEDAIGWYRTWATSDPRPRSSTLSTARTRITTLQTNPLRELFMPANGVSTITPTDVIRDRLILICDVPVKRYYDAGRAANAIWTRCFFEAIEDRPSPHPYCFVLMDEAHLFLTSKAFQTSTTVRSQGGIWIVLTQSKSNFGAVMGADATSVERVNSFLATLGTKIFMGNGDPATNKWASELIGSKLRRVKSYNFRGSPIRSIDAPWYVRLFSKGYSISEQWLPLVHESKFASLRPGEAYVLSSGKKFKATGEHYLRARFPMTARTYSRLWGGLAGKDEVQIVKE